MTLAARPVWLALAIAATFVAACGTEASGSAPPTPGPTPTSAPSPSVPAAAVTPPPGTSLVEIPAAGLAIPVPDDWRQLDAADLADPGIRGDLAAAYPGADALLEAMVAAGDRSEVVFLAVAPPGSAEGSAAPGESSAAPADGSAAPAEATLPASIAVLVSQPSVSGLLLEFVTGFIDRGLQDALDVGEPERRSVSTPVGDAIRLSYSMPAPADPPMGLVAWVIGAPDATVLVATTTPLGSDGGIDPDPLVAAAEVR